MNTVKLSSIFDISYGNKLDLNKMRISDPAQKHSIAFIGRTRKNNGLRRQERDLDDIHLLGRAGRTQIPLRNRQVRTA